MNQLIQIAMAEEGGGGGNFLVPNMTFVFEIVSFLIIMYVMYKWVLPPVNNAMTERQAKIKAQFDEAAQLKADAEAQLEVERAQALSQLKTEVGSIATTLAGRIVGESLDDDDRQKRSVERFIAELESDDSGKSKS